MNIIKVSNFSMYPLVTPRTFSKIQFTCYVHLKQLKCSKQAVAFATTVIKYQAL